jgi:hypothetical protein
MFSFGWPVAKCIASLHTSLLGHCLSSCGCGTHGRRLALLARARAFCALHLPGRRAPPDACPCRSAASREPLEPRIELVDVGDDAVLVQKADVPL